VVLNEIIGRETYQMPAQSETELETGGERERATERVKETKCSSK